jgi:hypothetical protein
MAANLAVVDEIAENARCGTHKVFGRRAIEGAPRPAEYPQYCRDNAALAGSRPTGLAGAFAVSPPARCRATRGAIRLRGRGLRCRGQPCKLVRALAIPMHGLGRKPGTRNFWTAKISERCVAI